MISTNNCTSPATGQANIVPSQDMILGYYFLTIENTSLFYILNKIMGFKTNNNIKIKLLQTKWNFKINVKWRKVNLLKYFNNTKKLLNDYKLNKIEIHNYIWITINDKNFLKTTNKKRIKIRKTKKNIRKIKFIVRLINYKEKR